MQPKNWGAILLCLMWGTWRERTARTIEGKEWWLIQMRLKFLGSICKWNQAARPCTASDLLDVVDTLS